MSVEVPSFEAAILDAAQASEASENGRVAAELAHRIILMVHQGEDVHAIAKVLTDRKPAQEIGQGEAEASDLTGVIKDMVGAVIDCAEQGYPLYPHVAQKLEAQLIEMAGPDWGVADIVLLAALSTPVGE